MCRTYELQLAMVCKRTLLFLLIVTFAHGQDELAFAPRVVIPRAFPAIIEPEVVRWEKADGKLVEDTELVLGVHLDGEARAYPINTLTGPRREIINDVLGGRSIAATW